MGLFSATGILALVRGMSQGRVVLVIPVAGVLSAAIPVVVDLLAGSRPGPVVAAGVLIGILAVALTGIGDHADSGRSAMWSIVHGAVAGIATGISLVLIDRAADSGLWPLVSAAFVAAIAMLVTTIIGGRAIRPPRAAVAPAAVMGLLVAGAFVAMMVAFPRGSLTVVAVIVSQYPAVTILLAALVWRQRPRGVQYLGVALALAAVGLIAIG
jgi:drug/metabolite transporter (DMT)-like permease